MCHRCGKSNHKAPECRNKDTVDLQLLQDQRSSGSVCRTKKKEARKSNDHQKTVRRKDVVNTVPSHPDNLPKLEVPGKIQGQSCTMEIDTGTAANFISNSNWEKLGNHH